MRSYAMFGIYNQLNRNGKPYLLRHWKDGKPGALLVFESRDDAVAHMKTMREYSPKFRECYDNVSVRPVRVYIELLP